MVTHPVACVQVVRTFNTGKIFYCARFHPDDAKQNVVMAGCGDKKIYQFDTDTGEAVQASAIQSQDYGWFCWIH